MIFIIFTIIVLIIAATSGILLLNDSEKVSSNDFLNLIEKDYSIINFDENKRNAELTISGDLNKDELLSLGKEISKKSTFDMIKILVFNSENKKIENGFYVEGLTNEVIIRNKSRNIKISEFKEFKLDTNVKDITLTDVKYNDLKNIDGIVYIDISSSNLNDNNFKEQLYLLAKTISNDNKDLKNVIITSNINSITYGISLKNQDKLKILENYDF